MNKDLKELEELLKPPKDPVLQSRKRAILLYIEEKTSIVTLKLATVAIIMGIIIGYVIPIYKTKTINIATETYYSQPATSITTITENLIYNEYNSEEFQSVYSNETHRK